MTTMLVPVGIAYAEASGVPGINGLYATIVPLIIYAIFGPSRILILGPDSSLAPVILGVALPLSSGDPSRAVALGGMLAIVSGVVCVGAGFARLGFVTELLSKPIRYGYMNGIALTVLLSQIPKILGFSVSADGPLRQAWGIAGRVLAGNMNLVSLLIGAGTLVLILFLKRWPRVPGILIAVFIATTVVAVFDLAKRVSDITRYRKARLVPGLVLFRWDAPLFFANAELFKERILQVAVASPRPVRWFVVAAEPVTSVDVTAADVLVELDEELQKAGIELCFAELKDPVRDKLRRFGLLAQFGERSFFPTIEAAVGSFLRSADGPP